MWPFTKKPTPEPKPAREFRVVRKEMGDGSVDYQVQMHQGGWWWFDIGDAHKTQTRAEAYMMAKIRLKNASTVVSEKVVGER